MKEFMINDTPVKMWARTCDAHAWKEVTNICSLPFVYHHVALMPDLHGGKGMPKLQRKLGQLQKSVDALGGGLTKIYCQVVYEERNKVCTFAT